MGPLDEGHGTVRSEVSKSALLRGCCRRRVRRWRRSRGQDQRRNAGALAGYRVRLSRSQPSCSSDAARTFVGTQLFPPDSYSPPAKIIETIYG